MGLINWIFDIYQHSRIDDAAKDAAAARAELASLRVDSSRGEGSRADAARLEAAIGELALATRTVQRMLVEKGVCTREEFAQRLRQVDAEDGNVDGRAPLH